MSELSSDTLRERLSGEQMVHRLRDWTEGDTLYGVSYINDDLGVSSGKTFREGGSFGEGDGEQRARERFGQLSFPVNGVTVLFRATVQNVRTEPRNAMDPGEPPLKFATLTDVEILDSRDESEDGDGDE